VSLNNPKSISSFLPYSAQVRITPSNNIKIIIMNDELIFFKKTAVVAHSKSRHLPGGADENHEKRK
jgi:hypothetical protein